MRPYRLSHIRGIALGLLVYSGAPSADAPPEFSAQLQSFANQMVDQQGFDRHQIETLLAAAAYRQEVIDAITRPAEAKPWYEYRRIFLTPERIQGGVEYWERHAATLRHASATYGVPPEIIVAILGVETRYGKVTGKYRALDALATLAFAYPKRSAFFRRELEQFLLLARDEAIDARAVTGSYAGALGQPQFIPSSYRHYAVDFDDDGQRDLWNSDADVIGSVANYFARNGWKPAAAVASRSEDPGRFRDRFRDTVTKPAELWERLQQGGVRSSAPLAAGEPLSLIRLDGEAGDEYWLGLHNFYVITRYNPSNLYAMAVYQLSQEIARARNSDRPAQVVPH
jgi:membrane-bound lytic murein transglycosylase B